MGRGTGEGLRGGEPGRVWGPLVWEGRGDTASLKVTTQRAQEHLLNVYAVLQCSTA